MQENPVKSDFIGVGKLEEKLIIKLLLMLHAAQKVC
jgi:hypothetical protein